MNEGTGNVLFVGEGFSDNAEVMALFGRSGLTVVTIPFNERKLLGENFEQYDAVVIDSAEVAASPVNYLKNIFKRTAVPVIIMAPVEDTVNHVLALEMGADDFIVKPCDSRVLLARTKVVMRREHRNRTADEKEVRCEGLYINHARYIVEVEGKPVNMPSKEFELLYFLASHPNHVFTREELLEHVWGFDFNGKSRTIDVHIKRIREKIERRALPWGISTVWSMGYKFEVRDGQK